MSTTPLQRLLDALPGARRSGTGWMARCPSHDDRKASLSVGEGEGGKVLLYCQAGCAPELVISRLGLSWTDLFPEEPERRNGHAATGQRRIVAVYSYVDLDGVVLYETVRYEPKDFRQRRPDPDRPGEWIWNLKDVALVPYRLPDLLAADPAETIYLCEGEKDADRLAALGLVATTSPMGAGKWRPEYARHFAGHPVALLPDNDPPGDKHMRQAAASLHPVAASVRLVELPNLPPKGDVSDWLDAGGTADALRSLVAVAQPWVPSPGEPDAAMLLDTVPPFPLETLPPAFARLVREGAASLVAPAEFIALPLLVASGAMIGNALELELKPGWRESTNLTGAYVGDPGAKKTPSSSLGLRGVYRLQKRLGRAFDQQYTAYEAELATWEGRSKKERGPRPRPPEYPHLVTTDATVEALAPMLQASKGLLLAKDELVAWAGGMNQYRSGGKGADRQHYLSMWSRTLIKVDRKSNPRPIVVPRPHLSVIGGIQPDLLPELADAASRQDGFLDRVLFAYPDPVPDHWEAEGLTLGTIQEVEAVFERLQALQPDLDEDGELVPVVVTFSAGAATLWARWYDDHAAAMAAESFPAHLRGPWAKLPAQLARIALILHALERDPPETELGTATLARAMDLIDYFRAHARRVYRRLARGARDRALVIYVALKERGPLTTRDIYRDVLHSNVPAERVHADLAQLEELGLVQRRERKPETGRPGTEWAAV